MGLPRLPSFGRLRDGKCRVWVTFFCWFWVHCAVPVALESQVSLPSVGCSRHLQPDQRSSFIQSCWGSFRKRWIMCWLQRGWWSWGYTAQKGDWPPATPMMHFEIITQSGSCGAYDLTVFSGETKGDFGLRTLRRLLWVFLRLLGIQAPPLKLIFLSAFLGWALGCDELLALLDSLPYFLSLRQFL